MAARSACRGCADKLSALSFAERAELGELQHLPGDSTVAIVALPPVAAKRRSFPVYALAHRVQGSRFHAFWHLRSVRCSDSGEEGPHAEAWIFNRHGWGDLQGE